MMRALVLPLTETPLDVCRDMRVSGNTPSAPQSTTASSGTKVIGPPHRAGTGKLLALMQLCPQLWVQQLEALAETVHRGVHAPLSWTARGAWCVLGPDNLLREVGIGRD